MNKNLLLRTHKIMLLDTLERAKKIAQEAHRGQKRKTGEPYITHPATVALNCEKYGEIVVAVAWLHDVVEDTEVTLKDLKNFGFSAVIIQAVDAISHRDKEPYLDYILRVAANSIATAVKLEDMKHNLSTSNDKMMPLKRDIWRLSTYILKKEYDLD